MRFSVRNPKDFFAGVIYSAFGLAAIIIGGDYPMGTATKMGAAYFPTVLGGLLVFIGVVAIVRAFLVNGEAIGKFALKGGILVIGATLLFGMLLRGAGLIIALLALVLISAYASREFRWGPALALAFGLTVFCVIVFVKGLGVPLPLLGSWFN